MPRTTTASRVTTRFTESELRDLFRTLDGGGTRTQMRARVQALQGRGVSNDLLRDVRHLHRQVRRSQGYNVAQGGTRRLRDAQTGDLKRLIDLPARQKLTPLARPAPPKLEGLRTTVTVRHQLRINGVLTDMQAVTKFELGPGAPSLAAQVAEASEDGYGSPTAPGEIGGRGYEILRVQTDL